MNSIDRAQQIINPGEKKGRIAMGTCEKKAKELQPQLVQWRRWCHQRPGVGFQVEETSDFVASLLEEWGLEVEKNVGQTGVVGIISGAAPGPTIAIRVDMDALPIQEENTYEFASMYPGKMHACGHDGHIAMGLGAAKLLAEDRHNLAGTVVVIFQPAEEGAGGAQAIIADGVLRRHRVQALVAGHLGVLSPELALGQVGLTYGPLMAAVNTFQARITGRGGHGALPQDTVDPIVISAEVISAWQRLISREISPLLPAVLTVGQIQGGQTHNIIPDQVSLQGTVRYFHQPVGDLLLGRMQEVMAGICQAWKAKAWLQFDQGFPPLVNDPEFTKFFHGIASRLAGADKVKVLERPLMVSEDAAFFLQEIPGTYFLLGAGDTAKAYPHHHPRFDLDESVLWLGTALLAETARQYTAGNFPQSN